MPARIAGGQAERRRRRKARAQLLLEIAARTFADHGFHEVSMADIASQAGVSKPVLYTHFASKERLYEAVVLHATDELAVRLRQAVAAERSPERQMWLGILAFLNAVEEHPEWWLLTRQAARLTEGQLQGLAKKSHQASTETMMTLFAAAADAAGLLDVEAMIEPLAHAFVGACASVAEWWIAHPETPKGTVAIILMNMLWMGFGDLIETNLWLPPEVQEP